MSFKNEFFKLVFFSGFLYFIVIGILALFNFEPLKLKNSISHNTAVSSFIASGVSLLITMLTDQFRSFFNDYGRGMQKR